MTLIYECFKNTFTYQGEFYRGVDTKEINNKKGIGSFTYSFEVALLFSGFVKDFNDFLIYQNVKLKDYYFVSTKKGENLDLSELLNILLDKSSNDGLLDVIERYSGESEIIAPVDNIIYVPYTRKDIFEYSKNNHLEYDYWSCNERFFYL